MRNLLCRTLPVWAAILVTAVSVVIAAWLAAGLTENYWLARWNNQSAIHTPKSTTKSIDDGYAEVTVYLECGTYDKSGECWYVRMPDGMLRDVPRALVSWAGWPKRGGEIFKAMPAAWQHWNRIPRDSADSSQFVRGEKCYVKLYGGEIPTKEVDATPEGTDTAAAPKPAYVAVSLLTSRDGDVQTFWALEVDKQTYSVPAKYMTWGGWPRVDGETITRLPETWKLWEKIVHQATGTTLSRWQCFVPLHDGTPNTVDTNAVVKK
jgi:hypothetical protein